MGTKLSKQSQERVDYFLKLFSKESKEIRSEISSLLPSQNELIDMNARSFREFALMPIAEKQGLSVSDPLFSYDNVMPPCPKCGEEVKIRRVEENSYVCSKCKFKFSANWNSLSSGTKISSTIWLKVLHCMLEHYTIDRTCEVCGIARATFYAIRNKLFYAMQIMMEDVKLYGHVQVDNTFVKTSFKGKSLKDEDYPDDSIFFHVDFNARPSKKRGGSRQKDIYMNSICIFSAVDESGHVYVRFLGVGYPTTKLLTKTIGTDKILLTVPKQDPFKLFKKNQTSSTNINRLKYGDNSILISDKEMAIIRFAKEYGIEHEYHVYRQNGKPIRLSKSSNNIQKLNNLHYRLKTFLIESHYVSSKYLPGYLLLFEFIHNTGATKKAICELFKILAKPGLDIPNGYVESLFTVPNYLSQWLDEDNPLRRFTYRQLQAYHLYRTRLKLIESGAKDVIKVEAISEATGYTPASIRRLYKNLNASGFDSLIEEYFTPKHYEFNSFNINRNRVNGKLRFTPELLAIYDEYYSNRRKPSSSRMTIEEFTNYVNSKYNLQFKPSTLRYDMHKISSSGLKPSLPPIAFYSSSEFLSETEQFRIDLYEEYKNLRLRYLSEGKKVPNYTTLCQILAEKYSIPHKYVLGLLYGKKNINCRKKKN